MTTNANTMTGTPVAGEIWSATLTVGTGPTLTTKTVNYTVRGTVPLTEVAAGLAAKINAAATFFVARVDGNTLVLENVVDPGFLTVATPGASGGLTITESIAEPAITRVALNGIAALLETWSVTIGGQTYDYTVESLELITARLAAAINAQAQADFTAMAEGTQIFIVNRAGEAFPASTPVYAVAPAGSLAIALVASTTPVVVPFTTAQVDVGATVGPGETYSIDIGSVVFSYTARDSVPLAEIAASLATTINASARYNATLDGLTLVIEDTLAGGDTSSFSITPSVDTEGSFSKTVVSSSITRITLGGTSKLGEQWTVTLSDGSYSYDVVVETSTVIAAKLAAALNTSVDPDAVNFTATADGSSVSIVNRAGTAFSVASATVLPAGTALVSETIASKATVAVTVPVSPAPGALVAGETWVLKLTSGGVSATYEFTAAGTDLQPILAALAAAINAKTAAVADTLTAPDAYTAAVAAGQILVFRTGAAAFTATLSIRPAGVATADPATATTNTVALVGSPVIGDKWKVSFNSLNYEVTIGGAILTLDAAAAELAVLINAATGTTNHVATSEGATLIIINRIGAPLVATTTVTPVHALTASNATTTASVALSGPTVVGETWKVSIGSLSWSVVIGGPISTLSDVAAALASLITADTRTAALPFTAMAEGDVLLIVNRSGTAFTPTSGATSVSGYTLDAAARTNLTAVLLSTPTASDTWRITVTLTETDPFLATDYIFDIPVGALDTQVTLAAAFAAKINSDGPVSLTAGARGNVLVIVDRDGAVISATMAITPAASATPSPVSGTSATVATVTFTGVIQPRELWTIRIDNTTSYSVAIGETYMVNSLPVVADNWTAVAKIFADKIGSTAGFYVISKDNALVIVKPAGSFTTQVRITPAQENTDGLYQISAGSAALSIKLIGSPVVSETWTVEIREPDMAGALIGTFSYVAMADDQLDDVAQALADLINGSSIAGTPNYFTAMVEGDRLVIARAAGGAFEAEVVVTAAAVPGGGASIIFSGVPVAGETWTVAIDDGAVTEFDHLVLVTDTLADIVLALTGLINGGTISTDFTAYALAERLVIVRDAGGVFTASLIVPTVENTNSTSTGSGNIAVEVDDPDLPARAAVLAGAAAVGEIWRVTVDGFDYDYTVVDGDTTVDIAAGLASVINTVNSLEGLLLRLAQEINDGGVYTASVSGTVLTINQAGFTIDASASDFSGDHPFTASDDDSVVLDFAGAGLEQGEEWTVDLSTDGGTTTTSFIGRPPHTPSPRHAHSQLDPAPSKAIS